MTSRADAVVDLSNVCRDTTLDAGGPARLSRFDLIIGACKRLVGEDARIIAIADDSLLPMLSPQDRRRLRDFLRDGLVSTAPKADLPILRLAEETGAIVVSRDTFKDHRKEFRWIADAKGRFWDWVMLDDGEVELRERTMPRFTEFELSRAADQDDLRGQFRLDDARLEEVLTHRWSCTNPACLSEKFASHMRPLPTWDGCEYRCLSCGSKMQRGPARPRAIELKFSNGRGDELRPVLEQDASLTVGREALDLDLARLAGEYATRLSGEHAMFDFDGERWFVTDLGSRNGTWIGTWSYQHDARREWERIAPRVRTPLTERCAVSLGDVIRVDRSGKLSVRS